MEAIIKIQDLKNQFAQKTGYEDWYDYLSYCKSNGFDESEIGYNDLIKFCCKHYVQEALKQASEKAKWDCNTRQSHFGDMNRGNYDFADTGGDGDIYQVHEIFVDKKSILNAYSLENIK